MKTEVSLSKTLETYRRHSQPEKSKMKAFLKKPWILPVVIGVLYIWALLEANHWEIFGTMRDFSGFAMLCAVMAGAIISLFAKRKRPILNKRRFQITNGKYHTFLLDTSTGESWYCKGSMPLEFSGMVTEAPKWVPVKTSR